MISTRTRLSAQQRRQAVLDAALGVFATNGYEATSIGMIAAAAGIARPVLYDHFDSKRELYICLVEREVGRMAESLASAHDPGAPLEERLRTLARGSIDYARRNGASARLLIQDPVGDPAVRAAHEGARVRSRTAIAAAILADPAFEASPGFSRRASAELLADLQSAMLERLVRRAVDRPSEAASSLSEVFVDLLL